MTERLVRGLLFLLTAALPLAAQTTPKTTTTPAHRTTPAATAHSAAGRCVTLPALSPQIPALPASAPCAKALYTVTRTPETKLEYASPLVSAEVRSELGGGTQTYSLDYVETKAGSGETVGERKCLTVHYTGYLEDGTTFDSSHDHPGGEPITFLYGAHQVIPGWDTGFEGMRMGGDRRLFIPYQLAYGEAGRAPKIPQRAELIFDIEVVSQSEPRQGVPPGAQCTKTPPTPAGRPGASMPGAQPGASPQSGPGGMPKPGGAPNPGGTPPPGMTPGKPASPNGANAPPIGTTTPQPGGTPPAGSTPPSGSAPPGGTTTPQSGTTPPSGTPPTTPPTGSTQPQTGSSTTNPQG